VVFAIQTMNDSSLWWKPGWWDWYKTPYDIISYNDIISASSLHEFGRNVHFIGL